jgi:hypothetical protein
LSVLERVVLIVPPGYQSREAASTMAQLDDQSMRLREDLEGVTPEELSWQPSPGMNTIGMLLAHNAIVEVFWSLIAIRGVPLVPGVPPDIAPVIGLGIDGDGIPIAEGDPPPAGLAGKDFAFYLDLLERARAYAKDSAKQVTDADLDPVRERLRRNGAREQYTVRWVLYHLVEHFAGHYGQMLLLRHQWRARARA